MATLSASLTVKHTLVNFPTQFWGLSLPTLVHAREVDTDFHRFRTGCHRLTGADRKLSAMYSPAGWGSSR